MNIGENTITATLSYSPTTVNPQTIQPPNLHRLTSTPVLIMDDYHFNQNKPMGRSMVTDLPTDNKSNIELNRIPQNSIINGYDTKSVKMLENMKSNCHFLSFSYQFFLDRNFKFSTRLSIISMISSSMMSIFAGFKLWLGDDKSFQSYSDLTMLISNFLIAAITTASKNYIDDKRNDAIRNYLSTVDQFLGVLETQLTFDPKYRMHADEFMNKYKDTYGKILSEAPNASIKEIILAKQRYKLMNYVLSQEEPEITTCFCLTKTISIDT
jgi:hypothetical protein